MSMYINHCRWTLVVSLCLASLALLPTGALAATAENARPKMVDLWTPGDSGQRMRIRGRVTSLDGTPVPNVQIYFRHADSEGIDFSYHRGVVTANEKGVYEFGSVIPGNSHRLSHVHVYVTHDGFRDLDTEFYFKHDPKSAEDDPDAIFLEAGSVGGETMMFGRYDITLIPN